MHPNPFEQYLGARGNYLRKSEPFQPGDGSGLVNFASSDYLSLTAEPQLAEVLATRLPTGSGASRLLSGLRRETLELEANVAAFTGYSDSMLFASGFQANVGILEALLDPNVLQSPTTVYSDIYCHASINLGLRLAAAGITSRKFRHNDLQHLESLLKRDDNCRRFIITETLFSMDGDCPDLDRLENLAQKYGAFLYLDDAHAFAALGEGGRGLAAGRGDLAIIGLGKGAGLWGALAAFKNKKVKEYLLNRCGGVIYSTAPSPILTALASKVLELLPKMERRRRKLRWLSRLLRNNLLDHSLNHRISGEAHIVALIVGGNDRALTLAADLRRYGFFAPAIRPPTVPRNTARLRFSLSAGHSRRQVEDLCRAIKRAVKEGK